MEGVDNGTRFRMDVIAKREHNAEQRESDRDISESIWRPIPG